MKGMPLISVIVPIYKVEKYLRHCLDSLAAQTYPNFEVILMDDGSPDKCPQICDEYAAKNEHFKVIHQSNSGLTTTRLNAISVAQGAFLAFVDGDDWVEPDYLSHLYNLRTQYKADISVCAPFGMGSLDMFRQKPFVVDTAKALQVLCTDKFYGGYVWNKLYPKAFWENLQLPPQNMFEDLCFNSQIFPKAKKIVFSPLRLYHYRILPSSISHQGFQTNRLFFFTITQHIKNYLLSQKQIHASCWVTTTQLMAYWRNWIHYLRNTPKDANLRTQLKQTCPSIAWYFKLDKTIFYKWFSVGYLIIDHAIEDFYRIFCHKKEC